jgi:hypothetical protein
MGSYYKIVADDGRTTVQDNGTSKSVKRAVQVLLSATRPCYTYSVAINGDMVHFGFFFLVLYLNSVPSSVSVYLHD